MKDVMFLVGNSGDDGYSNTGENVYCGKIGTDGLQVFTRFDNVTIPAGSTINSAVLRVRASATRSDTAVNVKVYCEAADDPIAPSDGSDTIGRALTTGTDWDNVPSMTLGSYYDSPDISSEVQEVIDRGGWASGQAIIVNVLDNGSTNNIFRWLGSYDKAGYEADLVVSYSEAFQIVPSENIEISESISLESDLIVQEELVLSEYTDLILGFDESLPTITQEITIAESVTIIRGLGGIPVQSESIELSESVSLLLGFDEDLPLITESINLSEYSLVDISPTVSVYESITVYDTGNIRPEIFALDDINVSEYVLTRRGYWEDVEDSFTVSDRFDVFHYTNWIRQNAARANQRFFFTLTGAADSTTDIEIPASAIFARKRSGDPTYLQVTIPSFNYAIAIALRPSGEMLVDMGYEIDGVIGLRERILEADLEDISTYEGPVNRSVVLTGHRTQDFGGQVVTFNRAAVIYRGYQTRARAFRFAFIDPFLNPGDTVVVGRESFTCNNIIYTINALRTTMEVREAL
jgi:hypothetical protein